MTIEVNAYTVRKQGDELCLANYQPPDLQTDQLLIEIICCGVCRSDVHFIENDWGDARYPMVPGHEIVGRVISTGKAVKHFSVGQRVGVSWQQGSCGHCEWCLQGEEEFCPELKAVCLGVNGGFADKVIVSERFALTLPDSIADRHVAPLLCAGATVYNALTSYTLKPGCRVGVLGMGGLGHLAVQFAVAMGPKVSVFERNASKRDDALGFGAEELLINSEAGVLAAQQGRFDFILSTLSADIDYQPYVDALRPHGILCFAGIPQKSLAISVFSLIIGQKTISAVPLGSQRTIAAMLKFAASHQIVPQVECQPMRRVNQALTRVAEGKAKYRVVVTNETIT